jgi:hypothetical protein
MGVLLLAPSITLPGIFHFHPRDVERAVLIFHHSGDAPQRCEAGGRRAFPTPPLFNFYALD